MFEEKDDKLIIAAQDFSKNVSAALNRGRKKQIFKFLKDKKTELEKADKPYEIQSDLKEIVSVAVGIIDFSYYAAEEFVEFL